MKKSLGLNVLNIDYTHSDLESAYKKMGVSNGRVVYITGNLGKLGRYETKDKSLLLNEHFEILQDLIGSSGTLVVPTHSFNLVHSKEAFHPLKTMSETGPFTNFILKKTEAIRQFHPFSSSTAIGSLSNKICGVKTRHVYGVDSPFEHMIDEDAVFISIGKKIEHTISIIHHLELKTGVPYRYVKEFMKNVIRDGIELTEPFYLHVLYRDMDILRDRNDKIIKSFNSSHVIQKESLGRSTIESFNMRSFDNHVTNLLIKDPYIWLKSPPLTRPYQK